MTTIRLCVIDPSTLSRAGLVSLLRAMEFGNVDEAASVAELEQAGDARPSPDVVLVDLSFGAGDVAQTMAEIGAWAPHCKVVFLAQELDIALLGACFAAGASGYLLKDISRDALQGTLRLVAAGEKVFPSALAVQMAGLVNRFGERRMSSAKLHTGNLSEREIDILRCLVTGYPNKTIAANLAIAESTVKVHLKRILRKTHASNRTQAAIWAVENGLAATADLDRSA
jgi:two-component system, NarL family, nitrate/nitrite response regulator NarL